MKSKCKSCGVEFVYHDGIVKTCLKLQEVKSKLEKLELISKRMAKEIEQCDEVFGTNSPSLKAYKKLMK